MTSKRHPETHFDWLIDNVRIATMGSNEQPYGTIENGAIGIARGKLAYVGARAELGKIQALQHIDAQQRWATPGLIDCHTHLVYGGQRAQEFAWRMQGKSYAEIAAQGGGILNTVKATRASSEAELLDSASLRLQRLLDEGVTSVEIKSGYGLDLDNELKMLRVARRLGEQFPVTVKTTYLAAHALPADYRNPDHDRRDDYIDTVCDELLPAVADSGLADAVDVFCEGIGFSAAQCERVFIAASKYQLPVKAHAEQLSDLGGARLAAKHQAMSVDHLEFLNADDAEFLQQHGTVAVLLPGAYYFLRETQRPPVDALRQAGVNMAVATDLNPGTSPQASLLLAVNQACVLFGLTPQEALAGVTANAARALGLEHKGQLRSGMDADLCLWSIDTPDELAYAVNQHQPSHIWQAGQCVKAG